MKTNKELQHEASEEIKKLYEQYYKNLNKIDILDAELVICLENITEVGQSSKIFNDYNARKLKYEQCNVNITNKINEYKKIFGNYSVIGISIMVVVIILFGLFSV